MVPSFAPQYERSAPPPSWSSGAGASLEGSERWSSRKRDVMSGGGDKWERDSKRARLDGTGRAGQAVDPSSYYPSPPQQYTRRPGEERWSSFSSSREVGQSRERGHLRAPESILPPKPSFLPPRPPSPCVFPPAKRERAQLPLYSHAMSSPPPVPLHERRPDGYNERTRRDIDRDRFRPSQDHPPFDDRYAQSRPPALVRPPQQTFQPAFSSPIAPSNRAPGPPPAQQLRSHAARSPPVTFANPHSSTRRLFYPSRHTSPAPPPGARPPPKTAYKYLPPLSYPPPPPPPATDYAVPHRRPPHPPDPGPPPAPPANCSAQSSSSPPSSSTLPSTPAPKPSTKPASPSPPAKLKLGDPNPSWLEEALYGPAYGEWQKRVNGQNTGKGKKRKRVDRDAPVPDAREKEGEQEDVVGEGVDWDAWEERKNGARKKKRARR